ncbi:MAG: hypothetical protein EHM55_08315, partial [Acidobacteria bacterium]
MKRRERRRAGPKKPRRDYSWLLILAAVLAAYAPALHGRLLWDDFGHVTVPELRSLGGLWRIWSELGATQQYYPLLHSAFWLEHRLWGDSFIGYHLTNVVLHSTAAYLLVRILRHLAVPGALVAGLIFALHPVSVESVAWISEQKNTLSAVFYLASAYVYLRFVDRGGGSHHRGGGSNRLRQGYGGPAKLHAKAEEQDAPDGRRPGLDLQTRHYWLAFGLFLCALLSKSVTATLPAALLLVLWWHRGRIEWRDVRPLVPWFVVAAAAGVFTAWFEHQIIGAQGEPFALTLVERILLAGRVIWFYLGKLFWPGNLIFVYPRWTIDASQSWQYLSPAGAVALAIALAVLARRSRGPLAGYLFFCGTLTPVLGFVNVYPFRFSYVADHFQYLASLGIIVPAASAIAMAPQQLDARKRRVLTLGTAAMVVMLAVLTWNRSAVYQDAETLFRDTIARNPQAWMAYQNLGTDLANQNRLAEAIDAFEGALRVKPDYAEARNNLVLAHMRLGDAAAEVPERLDQAIRHYEAVLRIAPGDFRARYNLGTVLMDVPERQGDALEHLERAMK